MDLGLTGRRYLVTGASRGLGRAVASVLVAEGSKVLIASRSAEAIESAARELGDLAFGVAVDLTEPGAPAQLVAEATERLGGLDGAFVSHGGPSATTAGDLTDEQLRAAIEGSLVAPIRLVREVVKVLGEGGSIAVLTSGSAVEPLPGLATLEPDPPRNVGLREDALGRGRATGHQGELRRARLLRHGPHHRSVPAGGRRDRQVARGGSSRVRAGHPASTDRRPGGARPCGGLPSLAGGLVCDRRSVAGGRRSDSGPVVVDLLSWLA